MTNLNWLTPKDIFSRYLSMAQYDDGTSALEFIEQCEDRLAYENSMFESLGAKAEDRSEYEFHTKPAQTMIRNIKEHVFKLMIDGAENGTWFAFGRRHPDAEEEAIPSRKEAEVLAAWFKENFPTEDALPEKAIRNWLYSPEGRIAWDEK